MAKEIDSRLVSSAQLLDAIAQAFTMLPEPVEPWDRPLRAEFVQECRKWAEKLREATGDPKGVQRSVEDEQLFGALMAMVGAEEARELIYERDNPA